MFEYIDKINYDDVTIQNLEQYFNNKYYNIQNPEAKLNDEQASTPYKASVTILKYNETEGNTEKLDLVKQITMEVTYKLGNKNQSIEMTKIKAKERE